MARTLVVGVDGREESGSALSLGRSLAQALGAELIEATAPADPKSGLLELARSEDAYMLVLGPTHHGRLGRLVPGSLAEKVIRDAEVPVAVAPAGYGSVEHPPIQRVGVAYDGEPGAEAALEFAAELAGDLEAELVVITAVPPFSDDSFTRVSEGRYRERNARAVTSAGVNATGVVEIGPPAAVLAELAVELDLLVAGSRARRAIVRNALGSVASELTVLSPCPVILITERMGSG